MEIIKYLRIILLASVIGVAVSADAVTKQEMEQARTIAAKAYLRYANDGSGYLDDLSPKTMEELESVIKAKEKENIKAFKAIPVPSDYQSWDKEKLVEYWAVTAFQNKDLLEKGRGGRIRARAQINKMEVSAPAPAAPTTQEEPAPAPAPAPAPVEPVQAEEPAPVPEVETPVVEEPQETASDISAIEADEEAILDQEAALEEDLNVDKETNYTWAYIVALAILVAVVIALILYAVNVMKKSDKRGLGSPRGISEEDAEKLEEFESAIADKNVEISMLKKRVVNLATENEELKSKVEKLSKELVEAQKIKPAPAVAVAESRRDTAEMPQQAKSPLRSIFLGRANAKGVFVRADRALNVGNSIYVLDTTDGYSGSFRVADSPAAWSLALSNPEEYLETACTIQDPDKASGASRIITETSGTAIFDGGCWRVIRKARVKYAE